MNSAGDQPAWLAEAWLEFGQRELAGARDNDRIVAFFRELGHEAVRHDETPWCAAFVGASLERAGFASTRSLRARSYSDWGEALSGERFGAVAVLSRGEDPALGHVGFLAGWTAQRIWLLGGNQGDRVSVDSFPRARLVGLRWPSAAANAAKEALFTAALEHVLKMEGGYSDDPHDPGGPTNKGITLATLAAWRGVKVTAVSRSELLADLRRLTRREAEEIYRQRYWLPSGCPALPPRLAFMHFDAAVNHGVGTAIRILQEAVGAGVDGEIGPETKGRIASMRIEEIVRAYAEIRRRKYRDLPHFWRFGRGWLARVERTLEGAEQLQPARAAERENTDLDKGHDGDAGMSSNDAQDISPKWWGQSMTIWGVLISAAASVVPLIAPLVGLEITADLVRQLGDEVLQVGQAVTALIGTLMAIYGRTQARRPLMRKTMNLKL